MEQNNYSVIQTGITDNTIYFEDGNLMGFVWAAPAVQDLCKEWEARQDAFLKSNSHLFRKSDRKSWNLYAVYLAMDEPTEDEKSILLEIEEDFRAARKIARGRIATSKGVRNALLPLVPIQTTVSISREDELVRLKERLSSLPGSAVEILLGGETYSRRGADDILRAYADKRNRD